MTRTVLRKQSENLCSVRVRGELSVVIRRGVARGCERGKRIPATGPKLFALRRLATQTSNEYTTDEPFGVPLVGSHQLMAGAGLTRAHPD
jgi:hypothetical protein